MSGPQGNRERAGLPPRRDVGAGGAALVLVLVIAASLLVGWQAGGLRPPPLGRQPEGHRRTAEEALRLLEAAVQLDAEQRRALWPVLWEEHSRACRRERLAWCRSEDERRLAQEAELEWEVLSFGQVLRPDQMAKLMQLTASFRPALQRLAARACQAGLQPFAGADSGEAVPGTRRFTLAAALGQRLRRWRGAAVPRAVGPLTTLR